MRFFLIFLIAVRLVPLAIAQNPVGQILASDAKIRGAVELAASGARVMSGSFVSAGESTAILKLDRGGEVRVCPRTSLSVATSQSGRDLMLGLSVGAIETHYTVSASADSLVTPDFRILLAGPGRFDFAIEAGKSGDTCIRALPGNSSSLIVSELMGDGTYQVKPAERLVFHNGRLSDPDHENASCGCVNEPPVLRASENPAPMPDPASPPKPETRELKPEARAPKPDTRPEPAPHIEVDAPFVFHADSSAPLPAEEIVTLHVARKPLQFVIFPPGVADDPTRTNVPEPVVAKAVNKPKPGRFFGRIKSFFASIFR